MKTRRSSDRITGRAGVVQRGLDVRQRPALPRPVDDEFEIAGHKAVGEGKTGEDWPIADFLRRQVQGETSDDGIGDAIAPQKLDPRFIVE